jgi:hypothetical protein
MNKKLTQREREAHREGDRADPQGPAKARTACIEVATGATPTGAADQRSASALMEAFFNFGFRVVLASGQP